MNQRRYLLMQLLAIKEYKILIETRLKKTIDNNTLMKHWCKRYAAKFRAFVVKNNLID